VNGRAWRGDPARIRLRRHAVIVLELGSHVPPHASYAFPPDPPPRDACAGGRGACSR
jgi:hypothetical protein